MKAGKMKTLFKKVFNQEPPANEQRKQYSSEQLRFTSILQAKECFDGPCKNCKKVCQLKAQRVKHKVSFCPGNPAKCKRSKIQPCKVCRATHLDLNVVSYPQLSIVVDTQRLNKDRELLVKHGLITPQVSPEQIHELELVAKRLSS